MNQRNVKIPENEPMKRKNPRKISGGKNVGKYSSAAKNHEDLFIFLSEIKFHLFFFKMSKWPKAQDASKNDLIRWKIKSIQNSNKAKAKSDDPNSERSKIFNVEDQNGKILFRI